MIQIVLYRCGHTASVVVLHKGSALRSCDLYHMESQLGIL